MSTIIVIGRDSKGLVEGLGRQTETGILPINITEMNADGLGARVAIRFKLYLELKLATDGKEFALALDGNQKERSRWWLNDCVYVRDQCIDISSHSLNLNF